MEEKDIPKRIELFSYLLGNLVSIIGLILAFVFLDRFDTGKKIVERQFEAVVSLAEYLSDFRITLIDKKLGQQIYFVPQTRMIKLFRERVLDENDLKRHLIFEFKSYFNDISEFQKKANNIWLPQEIKKNCRFFIIESLTQTDKRTAFMVRLGVLKESIENFSNSTFGEAIDEKITFSNLLDGFENLIKSINSWLGKHSGLKEHIDL